MIVFFFREQTLEQNLSYECVGERAFVHALRTLLYQLAIAV